jgi:hypothetical protein
MLASSIPISVIPAQAGNPVTTERRWGDIAPDLIDSDYWMPAFAGMTTTRARSPRLAPE